MERKIIIPQRDSNYSERGYVSNNPPSTPKPEVKPGNGVPSSPPPPNPNPPQPVKKDK